MIKPENFIKTDEMYNEGIGVDEYNNEVSLCMAQEGKDGKIYPQWTYPQNKDRQPIAKAIPHKISLGMKQQAIQRIEQLLMMIENL